ncbi:MAG TPA: hypothetical protein VM261_23925 [Kofleriaceae bacterium]|nr:hypothetical protein [Kofleriaceae bacterium]
MAVVIGSTDGDTRDEAFRAALGLSLRRARVYVAVTDWQAQLGPAAQRARSLLELMGHVVHQPGGVAGELATADVVEIWGGPVGLVPSLPTTGATAGRTTTHLVRPGRRPACATPGELVLHLPPVLDRDDADRLLDQLLTGDRVAVW